MGQEIASDQFSAEDFEQFHRLLLQETALLEQMYQEGKLDASPPIAGYELEAWLTDNTGSASPCNDAFLKIVNNKDVVPELSLFNVELNGPPVTLKHHALSKMHDSLNASWQECQQAARSIDKQLVAIGILPTIQSHQLCVDNMSQLKRYQALNQQVLRLRNGMPIELDIHGSESLCMTHNDVMLEAATTSFQIHLQMDAANAARYYNAAKIISAPLVAVSANSPFLFGKQLWEETRIPLFEQAVSVGGSDYSRRVTFGVRYAADNIFEVFESNRDRYPVLLPTMLDTKPQELAHLRLHNGTIWRWNRPLIGFNDDGVAHVRLEHRVIPAGPTQVDQIANMAFFFGLVTALAKREIPVEKRLPFTACKNNFYHSAREGMQAQLEWLDGNKISVRDLCLQELLPLAAEGLDSLDIDHAENDYYLGIIRQRLESRQTGAAWQRQWVEKYGRDWNNLVIAYTNNQQQEEPVHTWSL